MTAAIQVSLHGSRIGLDASNNLVLQGPDGKLYIAVKAPTSDASSPLVHLTGATVTITAALHAGKTLIIDDATAQAVTLPAASGTGNVYNFILGATKTGNQTIKVANSSDAFQGFSMIVSDDPATVKGFIAAAASDDTVTLNGTTTGGYVGDTVTLRDIGLNKFQVDVRGKATGTEATPFSATV